MGEQSRQEALSALLDGETSELERRRLLNELDANDAETWSRWHLARDLMHGHDSMPVPEGFAAGVMDGLQPRDRRPGWLAGTARVMVAASVAAATVVGWQFWNASSAGDAEPAVAGAAKTASPFAGSVAQPAMVAGGDAPRQPASERQRRARAGDGYANRLMMRHSELTARYARQGVTPDARMVSLEARNDR